MPTFISLIRKKLKSFLLKKISEAIKRNKNDADTFESTFVMVLNNVFNNFLTDTYKIYNYKMHFKGKLIIPALEISIDFLKEIFDTCLKELNKRSKIFLIDQEEIGICRDFFIKCQLVKIQTASDAFKHKNISSIELETIKE
ncbi:hypothetical protein CWI37_0305p0010 [Hamiltosporidium tvaerminnensis]|uniref:Uncharacterized protein n=1 Tax=Hamiltosporidium tvaerminnensis TaxID=1176355 RepID=A0A4Q9L759_9MICR|nr:hypothetical protein CWI37_0305p0010 [Hamiltosporidium tvaerminnensis]